MIRCVERKSSALLLALREITLDNSPFSTHLYSVLTDIFELELWLILLSIMR